MFAITNAGGNQCVVVSVIHTLAKHLCETIYMSMWLIHISMQGPFQVFQRARPDDGLTPAPVAKAIRKLGFVVCALGAIECKPLSGDLRLASFALGRGQRTNALLRRDGPQKISGLRISTG